MDGCRVRPSRVVITQQLEKLEDATRTDQLGLSGKRNGVPLVGDSGTKEVSFGYKSSSKASPLIQVVSRRSQSPTFNSKSNVQELKLLRRSQSTDRRRHSSSNPLSACSRPLTPSPKSSRPSTPAKDSVTGMNSAPRRLLVGKTHDGLWPSAKNLSLSFGMNSSKNATFERKWTPLGRRSSVLCENTRPVEDLHGRTVDRSRQLGLRSRNVSGNGSKSNSLITPSREVLHGRIYDSHVSDKAYKQLRSEVEKRVTLDCNRQSKHESLMSMSSTHLCSYEKALPPTKASRKSSSPITKSHHPLPLNKSLSAPCP